MGDRVLQGFADLLRDEFRAHDICCRYGGEEFCVLMTDTDDGAAKARVEELLERLAERVFASGTRRLANVAFSAGIVSFEADVRIDMDLVFRRADQALYAAKNVPAGAASPRSTGPDSAAVAAVPGMRAPASAMA